MIMAFQKKKYKHNTMFAKFPFNLLNDVLLLLQMTFEFINILLSKIATHWTLFRELIYYKLQLMSSGTV